jgi:hypothetical protein
MRLTARADCCEARVAEASILGIDEVIAGAWLGGESDRSGCCGDESDAMMLTPCPPDGHEGASGAEARSRSDVGERRGTGAGPDGPHWSWKPARAGATGGPGAAGAGEDGKE